MSRLVLKLGRREGMRGAACGARPGYRLAAATGPGPYGEPEWVDVPGGEFWMGSDDTDEKPAHRVYVAGFRIARAADYQCAVSPVCEGYRA